MTDHDDVQHRTSHQAAPGRVILREEDDEEAGVFRVRMPIATTGEVRNEGDDPLTPDEIEGMATQVEERAIGVFLDHGMNSDIAGSRYSATEKVGEWEDPALQRRESDGETELVATARLMDPTTLDESTGPLRTALASLKAQVEREMSLSSSIGWRDDDAYPGGVDLMETSIVGIGADPRTTSHGAAVATARDVLSETDLTEAEREALVAEFEAAVMGSDDTSEHDMTDDDTEPGDEAGDETRDEQDGIAADAFREQMLEMQRTQLETLNSLADALREDDEDEDEEEDDDGEENESDEDDDEEEEDEQSADEPSDTQDADTGDGEESRTVEIDGEEVDAADEIRRLREALDEAEPAVPDDEQDADVDDDAGDDEQRDSDEPSVQDEWLDN